jgi:hypothetical protein
MTAQERQSDEVAKLIRKLRWIGLESQATELKNALRDFPRLVGAGALSRGLTTQINA